MDCQETGLSDCEEPHDVDVDVEERHPAQSVADGDEAMPRSCAAEADAKLATVPVIDEAIASAPLQVVAAMVCVLLSCGVRAPLLCLLSTSACCLTCTVYTCVVTILFPSFPRLRSKGRQSPSTYSRTSTTSRARAGSVVSSTTYLCRRLPIPPSESSRTTSTIA
jgi:hypothetical protein